MTLEQAYYITEIIVRIGFIISLDKLYGPPGLSG
jgi:hypothetical protein